MQTHVTRKITEAPLVHASQRKGIIGGSQIGTIVGIEGCYSSEFETYRSYIGVEENPDDSAKESFYAGNRLEEAIAQWFSYDMQLEKPVHELDFQYIDADEPRLVLHPDREFSVGGKRYALECKTASAFAMRGSKWPDLEEIDRSKVPSWVPEKLTDGRPLVIYDGSKSVMPGYYCQCLWYYALAGYDGVFLARMTDNRLYIYYVEPDVASEKKMYAVVRNWLKRVDAGYIPKPSTPEEARILHPRATKDKYIDATDTLLADIEKLKNQQAVLSAAEKAVDQTKADIMTAIGDAEYVKAGGKVVATCKSGKQSRVDTTALKLKDPDTYNSFLKTIETARSLKLTN